MNKWEAVEMLNSITSRDNASAHIDADVTLLAFLDATAPEVSAAYREVEKRVMGFWYE